MPFGIPNVIGNVEDMNSMQGVDVQQVSSLDPHENPPDESMTGDQESYRDITPSLKRAARNKSKTRF